MVIDGSPLGKEYTGWRKKIINEQQHSSLSLFSLQRHGFTISFTTQPLC